VTDDVKTEGAKQPWHCYNRPASVAQHACKHAFSCVSYINRRGVTGLAASVMNENLGSGGLLTLLAPAVHQTAHQVSLLRCSSAPAARPDRWLLSSLRSPPSRAALGAK